MKSYQEEKQKKQEIIEKHKCLPGVKLKRVTYIQRVATTVPTCPKLVIIKKRAHKTLIGQC